MEWLLRPYGRAMDAPRGGTSSLAGPVAVRAGWRGLAHPGHTREPKVEPCRIGFITALRYIVDELLWSSSSTASGAISDKLRAMRQNIRRFVLPLAVPSEDSHAPYA